MLQNTFRQNRPEEVRGTQFKIYVTKSERELLEQMSVELHLPVGELTRIAIAEYLDKQIIIET